MTRGPGPLGALAARIAVLVVAVLFCAARCSPAPAPSPVPAPETVRGAPLPATPPKTAKGPNVLFIVADDLNDWVGALGGHPQAKTPNIDRLAARGVLFTNAHCAAPVCNPSRTSVLTGVAPSVSGVYRNTQPWREPLAAATTLPRLFRESGWTTLGAGKIFHGTFNDVDAWDEYRLRKELPKGPAGEDTIPSPKRDIYDLIQWAPMDIADDAMDDHNVATWCIERLAEPRDRPLFLACGIYKPHLPWFVPRRFYDEFPLATVKLPKVIANDLDDVPPAWRKMVNSGGVHERMVKEGRWQAGVQAYLAAIAYADYEVGRVLDALDRSPAGKDTIVVFWGDHGWHLGEKEHWRKFTLWERSTRTPLIVVAPGLTAPGGRCDRTVSLLDIYPTLAELCGVASPQKLDGTSLVPLLRDPAAAGAARTDGVVTSNGRGNDSIRTARWRLIRYADGSLELYDHVADPDEFTNLATKAEFASVVAELGARLPSNPAAEAPRRSDKRGEDDE